MIVHTLLDSSHLAGNLLGDPSERDLFVYLPPGYEDSDRRYPTTYLLQAYGTSAAACNGCRKFWKATEAHGRRVAA